jgi:hypothetical protein
MQFLRFLNCEKYNSFSPENRSVLVLAGKRFNMHSKISRAISIPAMW